MDPAGVLLRNISLQNTVTSAQLDSLQPGTMYTVTVVTEAVGLQSFASRQAVTGRYDGSGSARSCDMCPHMTTVNFKTLLSTLKFFP